MPKPVSEQVVVIIGASSGIGRASALAFARSGARVVCAARNSEALDDLVQEITSSGGSALAVPTDITDPEAVRALAAAAESQYGGIDTWVNCAAVGVWGRIEEITVEEFDRVMRVNFLGHVNGIHTALPVLRRGGGGVMIGISSAEGVRSVPLQAPYTASKWALRALYDSLRIELAQEGAPIAVSTILPAAIDTPFFEQGRSKIDALPKPPPPVYAPELVADAVVRASERPRREIPVGGAAFAFVLGQRISPALTDAILSIPRIGVGTQKSDRPDNGSDDLDSPVSGTGRVHGSFPGRVLTRSPLTRLATRLPRPGELATAAVAQVQRMRAGGADGQSKGSDGSDGSDGQLEDDGGRPAATATSVDGGGSGGPATDGFGPSSTAASDGGTGGSGEDTSRGTPVDNFGHTASGNADGVSSPAADVDARGRNTRRQDGSEPLDVEGIEKKVRGWGPNEGPELTPEQAAGLQEREEPVAAADFGELVTGDVGRDPLPVDAPETIEPQPRLGRRDQDGREQDGRGQEG